MIVGRSRIDHARRLYRLVRTACYFDQGWLSVSDTPTFQLHTPTCALVSSPAFLPTYSDAADGGWLQRSRLFSWWQCPGGAPIKLIYYLRCLESSLFSSAGVKTINDKHTIDGVWTRTRATTAGKTQLIDAHLQCLCPVQEQFRTTNKDWTGHP